MSKTYEKGFATIGQVMGAGEGASTFGSAEGASVGANWSTFSRDAPALRMECLKLANGEGGPAQMVVERAQIYLDFITASENGDSE
ncbi:hypothetical protein [Xanthobacter sp. KR7-225]|uniref:hypothetical protein n=1 Tax=Xanthobacter sp. KR7-225 TaxID=3156613 RepID=UPI0032B4E638